MRSMPSALSRRANSMVSSMVRPPSTQSVAEMRTQTGRCFRPGGADGADDFEREAGAVGERAAVLVGAVVGERREELVGEVAVGGVDFGEQKAGGGGAFGGGGEVGEDLVHAGAVDGVGDGVGRGVRVGGGPDDVVPAAFVEAGCAGLFPGRRPCWLCGRRGRVGWRGRLPCSRMKCGDAGERGDVLVGPDAEVAGGDAAFGADGGGFGDDGAGAADGAAAEVDEVPVVGEAVGGAVLAHGRDGDAVGEGEARCVSGEKRLSGMGDMAVRWWEGAGGFRLSASGFGF